jgi:hypothetical protein
MFLRFASRFVRSDSARRRSKKSSRPVYNRNPDGALIATIVIAIVNATVGFVLKILAF